MIIKIDIKRPRAEIMVSIVYKAVEWKKLEEYYVQKGLQKYTTLDMFGRGIEANVYRYVTGNQILAREIYDYGYKKLRLDAFDNPLADDINAEVISRSMLNVAIFRIIPTCENNIECTTSFTAPLMFIDFATSKVFKAVLITLAKIIYGEGKKVRIVVETN
jgi:hypothetical protein